MERPCHHCFQWATPNHWRPCRSLLSEIRCFRPLQEPKPMFENNNTLQTAKTAELLSQPHRFFLMNFQIKPHKMEKNKSGPLNSWNDISLSKTNTWNKHMMPIKPKGSSYTWSGSWTVSTSPKTPTSDVAVCHIHVHLIETHFSMFFSCIAEKGTHEYIYHLELLHATRMGKAQKCLNTCSKHFRTPQNVKFKRVLTCSILTTKTTSV